MPDRMKAVLQALVNSVKKHVMDKDMGALSSRIDKTLSELEALAS
ncbi:MAG: hypothetical protein ACP5NC_03810 [Nitrososphaeria archaeon]